MIQFKISLILGFLIALTGCFFQKKQPVPWEIPNELMGVYRRTRYPDQNKDFIQNTDIELLEDDTYKIKVIQGELTGFLYKENGIVFFHNTSPSDPSKNYSIVAFRNKQLVLFEPINDGYFVYDKIE